MIEPTDEMRMGAYRAARQWAIEHGHAQPDDRMIDAAMAAVFELAGRVRRHPTSVRERLDAVLVEAIPVSGGRVRGALRHLRWALSELDAERAATAARLAKWRGYQ